MAVRVHLFNDNTWWWTFGNIDNVSFAVTSVEPDPIPADFDRDYDVDGADFVILESCATGPGVGPPVPGCEAADLDSDNDVDQEDFGIFQGCISGEGNSADSNCAD